MTNTKTGDSLVSQILASVRIVLATIVVCCILYPLAILCIGQTFVPYTANGSLIHDRHGAIIGSESLAQGFSRPCYFWPRPSAVNYDASSTGGSNWSPTNPALRDRAEAILSHIGNGGGKPIPVELVTASGSGMDPDITLNAARYQVERVASARSIPVGRVTALLERHAKRTAGILTTEPLVNVLLVNMALDTMGQ